MNDISPLSSKHILVGALTFVLLAVAFVPIPMESIDADYSFEIEPVDELNVTIPQGESLETSVVITNIGNAWNDIRLARGTQSSFVWSAGFRLAGEDNYSETLTIGLNASEDATIEVMIETGPSMEVGHNYSLAIVGSAVNSTDVERQVVYNVTVGSPSFTYVVEDFVSEVPQGGSTYVNILFNSTAASDINLTILPSPTLPQFVDVRLSSGGLNSTDPVNFTLTPGASWPIGVHIIISDYCPLGMKVIGLDIYREDTLLETINLVVTVV